MGLTFFFAGAQNFDTLKFCCEGGFLCFRLEVDVVKD